FPPTNNSLSLYSFHAICTEVAEEPPPGTVRTFAGMPFVWIPAGRFDMGSAKTAAELSAIYGDREYYYSSEQPLHRVTITKGFWMGAHEVTQAEWTTWMGYNPSEFAGDNHPVESISWDECQLFIERLNASGEGVFRLPTEAEREYACRAGTTTEFYFGDSSSAFSEYEWGFNLTDYTTHPVARKKPNPWGLYDMHGNVTEWCADWYGKTYYSVSPEFDPQGPETGTFRVRRGGSFRSAVGFCRSAFRTWNRPDYVYSNTGVRLCRNK
ncbi:MAG TPA: formylglycine-generating enzyme family protein, partial [Candidatus Hydrogenedentes bacterium]|nr:formylglycine-generating enzyme family protein [Candidatus Hydrogenedentota bacterium]